MTNRALLLGSHSLSRQRLLREAHIPFFAVGHNADETKCAMHPLSLQQIVKQIALSKMEHVTMPAGQHSGQTAFVLTADTLCMEKDGRVQGKPTDRADAIAKIKSGRKGAQIATAFVVDKRVYKNNEWSVAKRLDSVVSADYIFAVPDAWIDTYLEKSGALSTAGAIIVEDFGAQFFKEVHGSYTTVMGLPMFELREALQEIGFFDWLAQKDATI